VIREVVEHPGAAVIVPVFPDGKILLVHQYRHAIGRWTWELPAGTLKKGERPLVCAKRELAEETGWRARRWLKLMVFYPSPGILSERMWLYRAEDLTAGEAQGDEDEDLTVRVMTPAQAERWIQKGWVCDAKSIIGLWALRGGW